MATTHEEALAALPADQRRALEGLRADIRRAAPDAVEAISYGAPAFKLDGRSLVSYGAAKGHCSFYVQSPAVVEAFAVKLDGFRLTKGAVLFTPERPIPAPLVRAIVQARVAEVRAAQRRR